MQSDGSSPDYGAALATGVTSVPGPMELPHSQNLCSEPAKKCSTVLQIYSLCTQNKIVPVVQLCCVSENIKNNFFDT